MKRLWIPVIALLVGVAAPARAWCEATCIAPADASAPVHCPSHEQPEEEGAAVLSANTAECPSIETARPVAVKLDPILATLSTLSDPAQTNPNHFSTPSPSHLRGLRVFDTDVPLRI